jgi:hypothetical protein
MCPSEATCGLLFQRASTIKIQLSMVILYKADLIIISWKIILFSPWLSWKIVELTLNNNHSLYQIWYNVWRFTPPLSNLLQCMKIYSSGIRFTIPLSNLIQCMKIYSSAIRFNTMYEDLLLHCQIYYNVWRFTPPLSDLLLHCQI